MNIFIRTYHMVRSIIMLPKKLLKEAKEPKDETKVDATDELMRDTARNVATNNPNDVFSQVANRNHQAEGMKRITWNYVVKNDYGQTIRSVFDAYSKSEVEAFLVNEGYTIVSIEPRKAYEMELFPAKLSMSELIFMLTQLSTYIRAGIPLIDSMRILAKQTVNPNKRKIYEHVVYDLTTGESFSGALTNQENIFPRLLINMIRTAEMTGDLPGTLDDMADYYTSIEDSRKQMISALTYPVIILIVAIAVVVFILVAVVPSFVTMYSSNSATLPGITLFTIAASSFLEKNYVIILFVLALAIAIYIYMYRNIKSFRKAMQTFFMKLPVFGNIIIYNEVTTFTKTFASLLNHSVRITDSMDILSRITSNEVYKEIIANTLNVLSKGGKISEAFRGHWAFPVVAYEMLVTGESTGQLGVMMEKVSQHFQGLHRNIVTSLKSLIEPITICLLAVVVGFILLSIVIPMFDMFSIIS